MKTFLQFLKESEIADLKKRLSDKADVTPVGDLGFIYKRKKGYTFWYKGLEKPSPYTYDNTEKAMQALKNAHEAMSNGDVDTTTQEFQDDFMGPQGKVFRPIVGAHEAE